MATSMAKKLKIKEGFSLLTVSAPAAFTKNLGELPAGVSISNKTKNYNQVHWFVMNKSQLDKDLNKVLILLHDDVVLWIYYPKGTSNLQTDLTRDKGWENLLKHDELNWLVLISFDDTWSAFSSRLKTAADKKKLATPKDRGVFKYADPKTKTITLPEDLDKAFRKNKELAGYFDSLAFSHKKEYIEWIVTAKREETRRDRVAGTLERLAKKWKNPRNL